MTIKIREFSCNNLLGKEKNQYSIAEKQEFILCPVCGHESSKDSVIIAPGFQYGFDFEFHYSQCQKCKAYYQNPRIRPKFISEFYTEMYYTHTNLRRDGLVQKLKDLKWFIEMRWGYRVPKQKGRLLDYGAGSGEFLQRLYKTGWNHLWGFEPDPKPFICDPGTVNRIFENDLCPVAERLKNSFDYIQSFHSLEHIPNPIQVMKKWYQMLKPGGKLMISTPNSNSLNFRVFKRYWYFLTAPLHYVLYSVSTLKYALRNTGFDILSVGFHSNSQCLWGSLDFVCHERKGLLCNPAKMSLNKNLLLIAMGKPLMVILDAIKLGDNLVIFAQKPKENYL